MNLLKCFGLAGALLVGLVLVTAPVERADAQEFVVIDGTHWQQLDEAQRVAFVSGVSHVLEFERQSRGDAMMADERSLIPHLVKAVDGRTVGEVSVAVTDYYVGHPDDLGRPVIATIVHVYSLEPM